VVKWRILSDPDYAFIPFFCHLLLTYLSIRKLLFSTNASEHLCKYLHLISLRYIFLYIYTGSTHSQTHTFSFSFLFVNLVYTYTIKPVFLENSIFSIFFFKFCEKESQKNENQVWKAAGQWHHSNGQMKDAEFLWSLHLWYTIVFDTH